MALHRERMNLNQQSPSRPVRALYNRNCVPRTEWLGSSFQGQSEAGHSGTWSYGTWSHRPSTDYNPLVYTLTIPIVGDNQQMEPNLYSPVFLAHPTRGSPTSTHLCFWLTPPEGAQPLLTCVAESGHSTGKACNSLVFSQ
ncbi:UNVERIFIED_CONTAM: hypothetical protein FKN15_032245 [Acipenser sinensis]